MIDNNLWLTRCYRAQRLQPVSKLRRLLELELARRFAHFFLEFAQESVPLLGR